MKILLTIAGAPVTLYGAMTAGAILLFWLTGLTYLLRRHENGTRSMVWMACTAVFGWLLSRVVFAACNAAYYIDELNGYWAPVLCFWDGGYSMIGLILGTALGAAVSAKLTGMKSADALNAAGLGLPLGIALLRLAEFLCDTAESGDIGEGRYLEGIAWLDGLLQRMGLLMQADGDFVYPACLAEALAALIVWVALVLWLQRRNRVVVGADVLTVSLVLYATCQLILEQIRDDGHLVFHFVHLQQVLALGLVLAALIIWTRRCAGHGAGKTVVAVWLVSVICIGLAVWACFGVDRWENKTLAWLLLIIPAWMVAANALILRGKANTLVGGNSHGA